MQVRITRQICNCCVAGRNQVGEHALGL